MKIVILDKDTLGDDVNLSCLNQYGSITSYPFTSPDETLSRVEGMDIIITNKVIIDRNIMNNTQIKLICVAATGMNNIDLEYAKKLNIPIKNVAGYSTPSVVQTTFAMALYLIGKIRYFDDYTKSDTGWVQSPVFTHIDNPYSNIENKTWGIIGLGEIGKKVAHIAEAFGAKVCYYSTSGRNRDKDFQRTTLQQLLSTSDIISIHSPLNQETHNLINQENLKLLKENAILLNLGRGGIINEKDLAEYMDSSNIQVALDVLEYEPIRIDNPLRFVKAQERILITPHIAWASKESRERLVQSICNNIKEFLGV